MKSSLPILSTWILLQFQFVAAVSIAAETPLPVPPVAPTLPHPVVSHSIVLSTSRAAHGPADSILIPSAKADPNALRELAADLRVMCRILDKTVSRTPPASEYGMSEYGMEEMYGYGMDPYIISTDKGLLGRYFGAWDSATKALYIDGYGVLLTINVYFPLKPSPKTQAEASATEDIDPVWREARQEVFEPRRPRRRSREPVYHAGMVDELKRQVRSALRHASNMRGIDPDEYITVVIKGYGAASQTADPSVATLTLRTPKRQADAHAAGRLSIKDFVGGVEVIEF